jgi:hypothetical protein
MKSVRKNWVGTATLWDKRDAEKWIKICRCKKKLFKKGVESWVMHPVAWFFLLCTTNLTFDAIAATLVTLKKSEEDTGYRSLCRRTRSRKGSWNTWRYRNWKGDMKSLILCSVGPWYR